MGVINDMDNYKFKYCENQQNMILNNLKEQLTKSLFKTRSSAIYYNDKVLLKIFYHNKLFETVSQKTRFVLEALKLHCSLTKMKILIFYLVNF